MQSFGEEYLTVISQTCWCSIFYCILITQNWYKEKKYRTSLMYRCIIAALSFCSQVIQFSLFLILARKKDVVALCDWEWLSCVEGFEEIKGLAYLYCSPPPTPISLHVKRLSRILAPNVQIGFPYAPRHSQYSPFGKLYGTFPRKFPEGTRTALLNFQKANHSTEMEWMETKLPGRKFWKAGYTSRGCPLLSEIFGNLVYLILEVARNLNRRFWLNWICEVGVGWRSGRGFSRFWNMWPTNYVVNIFRNITPHGLQSSLRQPCGG